MRSGGLPSVAIRSGCAKRLRRRGATAIHDGTIATGSRCAAVTRGRFAVARRLSARSGGLAGGDEQSEGQGVARGARKVEHLSSPSVRPRAAARSRLKLSLLHGLLRCRQPSFSAARVGGRMNIPSQEVAVTFGSYETQRRGRGNPATPSATASGSAHGPLRVCSSAPSLVFVRQEFSAEPDCNADVRLQTAKETLRSTLTVFAECLEESACR